MHRRKKFIARVLLLDLLILTGIVNFSYGQTKIDKLDKLVATYAEYGQFNGSILVAEKGKIIYKKGFGLANMEWNIPNRADTKHRLGSITKQFTSMLIMQLVQQNKLKLNVPISTYLPDYPKPNGDLITIHHLLSHTSGTPNFTSFPNYGELMSESYRPAGLVKLFADSVLRFKPGEKFEYSNSGYILLGLIIEKVTGKSYEQVLKENILTPLKMNNTGYDHGGTVIKNRSSGYERNGLGYVNATYIDMSVPFAAGALYSTVEDLYLWDQALYANQLLRKENGDLLFGKHISIGGSAYYGYGWVTSEIPVGRTQEKVHVISHSGGINGFGTLITRIPSDKSLIVLLDNTGGGHLQQITTAITGILYDKPYDFPKRSIANSLFEIVSKKGITDGQSFYKKVKNAGDYYLNEQEMNEAGYQLLRSGKTKEAAFVFKLNIDAFPGSFNAYDSYGEVLLALGDKTKAIENYKRSVELNPNNTNGINVLKDLGVNPDSLIKKE